MGASSVVVSSANSHLRAPRQRTESTQEALMGLLLPQKITEKQSGECSQRAWKKDAELRKDACRNAGNLLKGGYQGVTCPWKKTRRMNNRAGGVLADSCAPLWGGDLGGSQGAGVIHVLVSSREGFSVIFSYNVLFLFEILQRTWGSRSS